MQRPKVAIFPGFEHRAAEITNIQRGTSLSAGWDLYVLPPPTATDLEILAPGSTDLAYNIQAGKVYLFDTGLTIVPPSNHYGMIVPRSSSLKYFRALGIIDGDYIGHCFIQLIATRSVMWPKTKAIAQIIFQKYSCKTPLWVNHCDLEVTARGTGGFGSTDAKGVPAPLPQPTEAPALPDLHYSKNETLIAIHPNFLDLKEHIIIPYPGSEGAGGLDVFMLQDFYADNQVVILEPNTTYLLPTGLTIVAPKNHFILMVGRSSGFNKLIILGIIDSDSRGSLSIQLRTLGQAVTWERKNAIAQILILPYNSIKPRVVDYEMLTQTARGESGFGSTTITDV